MLSDAIYIKVKDRQNLPMRREVRRATTCGRDNILGAGGGFLGCWAGFTGVHTSKNSLSCTHKICALYCLLIIPQNVNKNKFIMCYGFYRSRKLISRFSYCLLLINSLLILDTYFSLNKMD